MVEEGRSIRADILGVDPLPVGGGWVGGGSRRVGQGQSWAEAVALGSEMLNPALVGSLGRWMSCTSLRWSCLG